MARLRATAACSAAARARASLSSKTFTITVRSPSQPGIRRRAILPCRRAAHGLSSPAGFVDCFHERQAAASLSPVATRSSIILNGLEKIVQDRLMPAHITDNRRGRTGILVRLLVAHQVRRWIPQVSSEQAILRDNQSAFRAGEFQLARITWVCRGSSL